MLWDMLFRHLVTLFLILLFSIKLLPKKTFRDMDTKFFWLPVISCLILVIEDTLESMAATDPSMRLWRIFLSVIGYNFRAVAAAGLLLVIVPHEKRKPVIWIPCILNLLVSSTAFFTDLAFGYDKDYHFYRGPLGFVSFIVPMLYLLMILRSTLRHVTQTEGAEKWIATICVLFCAAASIVDAVIGGIRINEAMMISTIFFYSFLYSHDIRLDPLTGLLNRQAFYDDCKLYGRSIGAVASLDMNGLKALNDNQGHQAGDKALVQISECIRQAGDENMRAYRIGGDEFLLLFFHDHEESIAGVKQRIQESVEQLGYHISVGYALCCRCRDLTTAINESDRLMYEDKARYYRESGRDRRRRR